MRSEYYIFIFILLLLVFTSGVVFPSFWNRTIVFLNDKLLWDLPLLPEKQFLLGLDLKGGVQLIYQADLTDIEDKRAAMMGLRDVIERRINLFGVTEPVVQIQGEDRLVVELPGVVNVQEAIQLIGETPYLEFLEQRSEEETKEILDKIKEVEEAQKKGEEITKIKGWELALQNPFFKPTNLTGRYLKKATLVFDQQTYKPEIRLKFNDEGAKLFEEITARNIKKRLAIFLDGYSIIDTNDDGVIDNQDLYAPVVQDKITGGTAVITGEMDVKTANLIVKRLNSGALPVKIGQPISQNTIGPSLGIISLKNSLRAGIYGFLIVAIFLIVVYRWPGFLASLALGIYVLLNLTLFKLIPVTLTLAGIGGFILSIGMAVDANILIFARMREEIKKGREIGQAIREGFKRAWPSIRDSNFNSLIVCLILFLIATSFVRGFAFTLALGIITSMFSAIFITRVFLQIFIGRWIEKVKWIL